MLQHDRSFIPYFLNCLPDDTNQVSDSNQTWLFWELEYLYMSFFFSGFKHGF